MTSFGMKADLPIAESRIDHLLVDTGSDGFLCTCGEELI